MKEKNYTLLRKIAIDYGADLFGVTKTSNIENYIHEELKQKITDLPYAISIGIRLQKSVLDTIVDRPNQIYKTHYRQVNTQLDNIISHLAVEIQRMNYKSIPIAASYIIDWTKQNAHVSHRHVALHAGLGFWGKNNLLVHPKYGAGVRLISLFTDMPLKTDIQIENDCKDCKACIIACPAKAIEDDHFIFNKCYEQVRNFSKEKNYNVYICGLCVKACTNVRSKTKS